ncbi:MAG: DUF5320 domain-containing protein [Anaerolineae bacterium]|nr:DUF5320 domain-containing protein [Anaerolineae bacterium]
MPGFDGTGPRGEGPFTGRGEGYCVIAQPETNRPYGYTGLQGTPESGWRLMRWLHPFSLLRYRGRRGGRGRGHRVRW